MSKYGAVIDAARNPLNQQDGNTENQITGNTENQNTGKNYNQITGKPDNQITSTSEAGAVQSKPASKAGQEQTAMTATADKGEEVNLSIKVPKSLRRHWSSEAKRQDTSVTAVIIESLKARFGEPTEH